MHAGGDAAGAEVHRALRAGLLASRGRGALTGGVAVDAAVTDRSEAGRVGRAGWCRGLGQRVTAGCGGWALRAGAVTAPPSSCPPAASARSSATTTSPAGLTGDGLALAARAGAEVRDVEFVQFHPTVLWQTRPAASAR